MERLEQELGREQDRLRAMLNHLTTSTSGSRVLAYTYDYAYTLAQPPPQVVQGYIDYNHAVSTSNMMFVLNAHASQMGDSWPGPGGGERFAPQGRQLVARYKG